MNVSRLSQIPMRQLPSRQDFVVADSGPVVAANSNHHAPSTGLLGKVASAGQVVGLAGFVAYDLLALEPGASASTAQVVGSLSLLAGFAILAGLWSARPAIDGAGTAARELVRRAFQAGGLVLASSVAAVIAAGGALDAVDPLTSLGVVLGLVAAGVLMLWIGQARRQAAKAQARRLVVLGDGEPAVQLAARLEAGLPGTAVCLWPTSEFAERFGAATAANAPDRKLPDPKLVELAPDAVVISPVASDPATLARLVAHLAPMPIDVLVHMPNGGRWGTGELVSVAGLRMMRIFPKPPAGLPVALKRLFDIVAATALLVILSPLLALVAVGIKLDSRGPVLFRQPRIGLGGANFMMFKFRTMRTEACDVLADKLTAVNDPRVTRLGNLLRRTSIDELPQLLNVLLGSMSLVGPRPHALNAKAAGVLYHDAVKNYAVRHRMKPGITGLAQISGWRGPTDTHEQIEQRVAHDLAYISRWSFLSDIGILFRTAFAVCGRQAF